MSKLFIELKRDDIDWKVELEFSGVFTLIRPQSNSCQDQSNSLLDLKV